MDWKREIKLSDLFKRRPKDDAAEAAPSAPSAPKAERKSLLKRETSLFKRRDKTAAADAAPAVETKPERTSFLKRGVSLRRRKWDPAEAAGEPKPPRAPRKRGRRSAPPLPEAPLMRAFDLLPRDDPRQATGRRPSTAQLVLAVVGLVVVAALAALFLITNARVGDKEREYNDLREQLAARSVPAEEPSSQMADEDAALVLEQATRTDALASALGSRIAWDRLLREFSLILPEDVWLKTLKATSAPPADAAAASGAPPPDPAAAARNTFDINGYARDQEGIAQLLTRMAVLPEIQTAQLVSATKVVLEGETVIEFTITAVVKPREPGANS